MDILWGLGGAVVLLALAVAFSTDRRSIRLRTVIPAFGLQLAFGALVLYVPWGRDALTWLARGVQGVIDSSKAGIGFLFGPILPKDNVIFAFQVLPVIVFFASLTAVLFHMGVLQRVVALVGGGLQRLLSTGREESMNAAANIFLGQTEAPLIIRPWIPRLNNSALFAVMVGGLATVAGSVLVGYSLLGARLDYLIAASFMAAPGALLMAKIMVPDPVPTDRVQASQSLESENARQAAGSTAVTLDGPVGPTSVPEDSAPDSDATQTDRAEEAESSDGGLAQHRNVIDAAAAGAAEGLHLALTIGAMLLAFISLIALINLIIGVVGGWFGADTLSFEQILGWIFAPLMTVIGVPWSEAVTAGSYVGQKTVVNEFVAFTNFAPNAGNLSGKTQAIVTFALTGFANLGSLGILLGGLGGMAPKRRGDIATLGMRAILAATLANLMSATIAGVLIG